MKTTTRNLLFALLFLLGSKLMVNAQAYIPMVVEGNKVGLIFPLGQGQNGFESQVISCDTLIAGKIYKKVYRDCGYGGAIREDIVSQKIYSISANSNQEILFINFAANVGDTVIWGPWGTSNYKVVRAISSQLLFGRSRKVISFDLGNWVEGIGSSITGFSQFSCVSKMHFLDSFINVSISNCSPKILGNKGFEETGIKVYPNPAKDYLIIETENDGALSGLYSIYDLLGKQVKKGLLPEVNSRIDLKNFRSGVYVLIINVNGKAKYLKFQVQE